MLIDRDGSPIYNIDQEKKEGYVKINGKIQLYDLISNNEFYKDINIDKELSNQWRYINKGWLILPGHIVEFPIGLTGVILASSIQLLLGWSNNDEFFINRIKESFAFMWGFQRLEGINFTPDYIEGKNKIIKADLDQHIKDIVVQYHASSQEYMKSPTLIATTTFYDSNSLKPNKLLDAGETGELVVNLENQGEGSAFNIQIVVSSDNKEITIEKPKIIEKISAKDSHEIRIPIHGELDLSNGQTTLIIETRESRGNDAKKIKLTFQTAALERPDLQIASVRINDTTGGLASGNGNGIIENGETVELQLFVENNGVGDAYGVYAMLDKISPSGIEIVKGDGDIGQIPVGATAKAKMVVHVPRDIDVSNLQAEFRVEEKERKAARAERMIALSSTTLKPELMAELDWNDGTFGQANGNGNSIWENGEQIAGTLTIQNNGSLAAENMKIKLTVKGKGVDISPKEFRLDRLEPGMSSIPLKTALTIPRTFNEKDIEVDVKVSQKDFPEISEHEAHAVNLLKPSLAVSWRLRNNTRSDDKVIGSVIQGENTQIEIRVRNNGELDANGVNLLVSTGQEYLKLGGKNNKSLLIGTIPAGRESEPLIVPVNVLNRVPVGETEISFEVTQDEFQRVAKNGILKIQEESMIEVEVAGETSTSPQVLTRTMERNPVLIASIPPAGGIVKETFDLVWDEIGDVSLIEIKVNGKILPNQDKRGIGLTGKDPVQKSSRHRMKIPLEPGENVITLSAYDLNNKQWTDEIRVTRIVDKGEIWAVVMGVSKYQHVESLKYARRDAEAFAEYLRGNIGLAEDNLYVLYDEEVTAENMRFALGTWLRKHAALNDTVYIYFAGHGAPDPMPGMDGDNFEKYLLPYNADQESLISTALPMDEISKYFRMIKSERMVFIVDSCFSGATGGRTVLASNMRATGLSDRFWERLSKGKGRVILSASRANEVSMEDSKYGGGHGVFTHFLLKGLKGEADYSHDGLIDIDEVYRYLSIKVPDATRQSQTPVKKGEIEGTLILGKVR